MSKSVPLKSIDVRYKGVFDFEGLYDLVYKWLKDRKYKTHEDKYKNKPDSAWGYEHEVKISATKKIDAYYKYKLKLLIHVRDGADIMHEGEKLMNGRVHVQIRGKIILDYQDRWNKNGFTEFLHRIYRDVIIKREIEFQHWDPLYYRLHDFQEEIKKHLNMYADVNY